MILQQSIILQFLQKHTIPIRPGVLNSNHLIIYTVTLLTNSHLF